MGGGGGNRLKQLFDGGRKAGDGNSYVSKKKQKHIENRHNPNTYAQQIQNRPKADVIKELENKTFFNKNWNTATIKKAVNTGVKQALSKGITSGQYVLTYHGEKIIIILEAGRLKTAFGSHRYTYQQLLELLRGR